MNTLTALDRLLGEGLKLVERLLSIISIRPLIERLRARAIPFKASQNASSRDTEVAWPAILTDLFWILLLVGHDGWAVIFC